MRLRLQPTTRIAYCLLPTAYCLLPTAYCLLLTAYCFLPTDHRPSDLQPFILRKQLGDLGVNRLFFGEVCDLVPTLHQLLDLVCDDLLLRLRLLRLTDVVLIVHRSILLPIG